ncbi:putative reverse transcriptase domain-containing protein [Tanacetum coccineum]|uniref:Reverse transcriptase domain-containing protein n=1 Tax=Tanacetum coccineum TaxID=301880 RepID=A0ABQ5F6J7_9ASTR
MEKLVKKLGNVKDKVECKKLKKELEESRFSNTFLRIQNERVERDLYWTRVRAHEFYQEMIRRGFVFEDKPNEAINVPIEDEKIPSSEPRGSPHNAQIMPPKSTPMTQAAIRRMIKESVDAAIAAERARQANVRNDASGSRLVRGRDTTPVVHECTFAGFMKCNPDAFHGVKGAVELRRWYEKTESVFEISECAEAMGLETVNQIPWTEMKQLMTAEFCPIEEIQRMEHELWNLKIKEYGIVAYTQRFNELALMCPRMGNPERVKVDAYIQGLTDNIKGEVTSSKPADLNEAVRMAHKLMEQKSQDRNERILEGKKRKWENLQGGNSSGKGNQKDNSRQTLQNNQKLGNALAMVTAPTDGKLPLCKRCFTSHVGQCTIKCHKCGKVGHKAMYYREKSVATGANAQPIWTCYDCGEQGHTRNRCPKKVKQEEVGEVRCSDWSFVNTRFSSLLDIKLIKIEDSYKLGTFDIIIGMDWLVKHDAVIVCGEKVVRIPYRNKTLIVEGDKGGSRLKIISCIKARKYVEQGCHLFLAHIMKKKSKEKRMEDLPVFHDFPEELLEYVIGTCPKSFNERDNKAPSTPVTRKKQVTFNDKPGTSSSNTQKHEVHQKVQQPRSNTKKNRIVPAKSENKKKVEDHPRTNKSVWTKVNRVDSSISSKRVVINSNSESVCKTCNKCLNSASHEMCVVNILNSVNATPTVKIVLNKGKQIWKPKGKLSDNSLNKTKQVWKATGKLFANVGYQWRSTGKKVALGKLNCGYQWRPTGKKFALGELCPLTKLSVQCCSKHMTGNRSKLKNFVEKFIGSVRFGNDHFGAIMGYGDYVIGDSVISRVYYVEGLGHNLFSVGQFCDSDLEVAFRKHSCFVRDINGADLLKGSRRTNLYTISIDDMMKSSPICLLSKASKSKSWLWHRRLNHVNFGTINDLARKDLVRVFGALCYPTNDSEDLGNFQAKLNIGDFRWGIYVSQPEGFKDRDNTILHTFIVWKKALDGLKQAIKGVGKPTKKHLEAIKRIFRYLKGTINMGLWYPKDAAIALTAYADADHAGCQDTRKSTSGSAQFLGDQLVSWSSKKQRSTASHTTEAEYNCNVWMMCSILSDEDIS